MTKVRFKATKFVSMLMIIITLISSTTIFCYAYTSGNRGTRNIYVKTGCNYLIPGSASITIKQNKFSYSYIQNKKKKYGTSYAVYEIKATAIEGPGKTQRYKTFSSGSIKINLDKNTYYRISVSYNGRMTNDKIGKKEDARFLSEPSWYVSGTYKVKNYW